MSVDSYAHSCKEEETLAMHIPARGRNSENFVHKLHDLKEEWLHVFIGGQPARMKVGLLYNNSLTPS